MHKTASIQYCKCGYPLSVITTSSGGVWNREFVDWTSPSCRLVRCPRCFAALEGKGGASAGAHRRQEAFAAGA